MTYREDLFTYRINQAEETITDVEKMIQSKVSPRSIINRAYYSMFYAVLALFLNTGINLKTSKHVGIISIFDKEFVHTGKIDKQYSKILHKMFEIRQEGDYKELTKLSLEDAVESLKFAKEFLIAIKNCLK